ncbi:MAG: SMC-Scp complex subunit ScpB [Actinomycetota bacterium]|jgi:segregation and condensation protein B|nr:SMC-Scp complex subunit ScpB [Actinomycetota bacterium]MDA8281218.1 SMC-Scp complex subunit ScpB [Actinomycetota bacterium]
MTMSNGWADPAWGGPADPGGDDDGDRSGAGSAAVVEPEVQGSHEMPEVHEMPEAHEMPEVSEIAAEDLGSTVETWADPAGTAPSPPWVSGGELGLEHRAVEAVVLCAVEPVPAGLLAELLELSVDRVERICADLARDYRAQRRGFVLVRVAGGYRYQTDAELAPFVERFAMEGVSSRLSSAALETLAIVAYKQPVSRGQVSLLRGVNVDGVVRLLVQRGLIAEVGHAPGPGQPVLYGTTPAFLEKLGLDSLDELPAVEDLFPGPEAVEVLEARLRPGADAG